MGHAIFLTNQNRYWIEYPMRKEVQRDWDFRIHERRVLKGELKWNPNKEEKITATKERRAKFTLKNQYRCSWKDYSNLNKFENFMKENVKYPQFKYLKIVV